MHSSFEHNKGSRVGIFSNRGGPDEMPRFVAFHPGLHCLSEYPFRCSYYKLRKKMPNNVVFCFIDQKHYCGLDRRRYVSIKY